MTLCTTCKQANKTCPIYPQQTKSCAEYDEIMLPCPHCGNTDLTINFWTLEDGEVDAIECSTCYAGAPKTTWNKRATPNQKELAQLMMDFSHVSFIQAHSLITGLFVGFTEHQVITHSKYEKGDEHKKIKIDGGHSRDITLHATKKAPKKKP